MPGSLLMIVTADYKGLWPESRNKPLLVGALHDYKTFQLTSEVQVPDWKLIHKFQPINFCPNISRSSSELSNVSNDETMFCNVAGDILVGILLQRKWSPRQVLGAPRT